MSIQRLDGGLTIEEMKGIIEDVFGDTAGNTKKDMKLVIKEEGATELTKELKALNAEMAKFQDLNQVQKNSVKLFGSQEKMVNSLKKAWNEYVTAVKNGLINSSGGILVAKDNKQQYKQAQQARSSLMSSYNAMNVAYGFDSISNDDISANIKDEIQSAISSLKLTDSFKNYNLSEERLQPVFDLFVKIQEAASEAGMTIKDVFDQIGISFSDTLDSSKIENVFSLFENTRQAAESESDGMEGEANRAERAAERAEEAAEREKKALETLEQVRQRAYQSKKKTYTFYDNDDFNEQMYSQENTSNDFGTGRWVDLADYPNIQDYQNTLQKLKDLRDEELKMAKSLQNQYAEAYNQGNDGQANEYLERMQKSLDYYNKFSDAIEYVQNQLQNAALNFKPGEEWGADEIANLIQLLQDLVKQVQTISSALGKIDDDSGISPLLSQFNDLATEISHVAMEITALKTALQNVDFNLSINAGGNNAMVQNTLITNARRNALDVYKDYYNSLVDYLTDDTGSMDIFVGKGNLAGKYMDLLTEMNPKSVNSSLYTYEKLVEILKEAASLSGIDLSPVFDKFEPKVESANNEIQKFINTEEEAAKSADRIKDMFGGGANAQIPIDAKQIDDIITSLSSLQDILSTGLGLKQNDGITTYFDTLIQKMQDIIDKSSEMIQHLREIPQEFNVYRGTNGDSPLTANKNGYTFWSRDRDVARQYGTDGADKTLFQSTISMKNPLTIDAKGARYEDINYLGDGADEVSRKLIDLTRHAEECKQKLLQLQSASQDDAESMERASSIGMDYIQTLKEIKNISDDLSNPYGKHSTDWLADYAKRNGYGGLRVKNVIDTPDAYANPNATLGEIYVTFDETQLKNTKLIEQAGHKIETSANLEATVSMSENSTLVNDIQALLDSNTFHVNTIDMGDGSSIDSETQAFGRLKETLTAEIPEAVDKKTQAFRSEQVEVDNLIDLEIDKIKELAEALKNSFAQSGNTQEFGALSKLIESLNALSNSGNIESNITSLSKSIEDLVNALAGANDVTQGTTNLAEALKSIKLSKSNVTNLQNLSGAINSLVHVLEDLGKSASMATILAPINEMLEKADALRDLTRLMSASAKQRRETATQLDIDEDAEERKSNLAAEKQIENLTKYYAIQDQKKYREINGKNERMSINALAQEENLLKSINQFEAEIQKKRDAGIQLTSKEISALVKKQQLEKAIQDRELEYRNNVSDKGQDALQKRRQNVIESIDSIGKELNNNLSIDQNLIDPSLEQALSRLKQDFIDLQSIDLVDKDEISRAEEIGKAIKKNIIDIQNNPKYIGANTGSRTSLQAKAGKWLEKNTAAPDDLRSQVASLYSELSNEMPVSRLREISSELNRIEAEAAKAGKTGKSFVDMLGVSFKNLGRYLLSFASFYRIIGIFRQAVGIVKELDTALMEVRKVSSESLSSLKEWQQLTFSQANDIGGTAQQIQESTAAWLRLGKSFEEASEAAQASVKLLNVSEFTNIDDATTSLVSMRQAFKDLSYEDFIDKLNGVGDNFSSSTDQLAFGMRNVSSVLKVAGNDIDQSLALLTAANDITQDMSKASMGVRTVALRIAGTEDAKAELEELGEDTSDFIVQTQSKVDAKVRKYTATADNPNGISVLDDNGRLRSTYDILLDISKVYDQIVEKDNQFGTNTSNALLELLAGKTRSNILASILQNPTVLEEAYTQSQNSKGIGQKELDIYLDSIQAKMTKLQNALQKLASVTINSDWLKILVDLGTEAVKIFSTLTEKFGSFSTVIAPIISMFLQRKGLGMLPSKNGQGIISMLFGDISKTSITRELSPIQKQVQSFFSGIQFDNDDNFLSKMTSLGFTQDQLQKSDIFGPMLSGMEAAETQSLTMGSAISLLNDRLGMTGEVASQAGGLLSRLSGGLMNIGKSLLSIGLSTIVITAVTKGIELLVKWVYNWATANERAIETGKKAHEEAEQLIKAQADAQKQTKQLGERYNELRKGVTYTDGKGYTNKDLSEDDFSEFLQINKEIVALYPQLRAGTDAQGNAYVNLGDNANKATEQLEKYLEIQDRINNKKIGETFDDQFAGVMAKRAEYQEEIENETISDLTQDILQNGIGKYITQNENGQYEIVLQQKGQEIDQEAIDAVKDILNKSGLNIIGDDFQSVTGVGEDAEYTISWSWIDEKAVKEAEEQAAQMLKDVEDQWKKDSQGFNIEYPTIKSEDIFSNPLKDVEIEDSPNLENFSIKIDDKVKEEGEKILHSAKEYYAARAEAEEKGAALVAAARQNSADDLAFGMDTQVTEETDEKAYKRYEAEAKARDELEGLRPALLSAIKGTVTFDKMSEELQNGIIGIYSNIDLTNILDSYEALPDEVKKNTKFIDYLKDQYLYMFNNAIHKAEVQGNADIVNESINKLFSFDDSKLTADQANEQLNNLISQIFQDEEDQKTVQIGLGIEYIDTETGKPINKYAKQNQDLYDVLGDYGLSLEDISSGLTIGEKDIIQSAISSGTFNLKGSGLGQLKEWLNKEYEPALDGSLSDIFNDASYKENTEEISSNISTISSSLETLRNNGKLTAEEMMKLQESFPDMTEFTEEALSSRGVELLSKWIEELRKDYDTFSDEGKEQVDTYINNLMTSFSDAIATEEDAVKALYDSFINPTDTEREEQLHMNRAESVIKGLKEKYGDELDWNIVWQLAVNDQLSGEMEDIYNRYDERVLNWDIIVNIPKEVEQLERNIAGRNARISAIEAEKGYYDATGEYLPDISENWFDEMLRLSGQNVADKTVEYTNAQKTYTAYTNGLFGKMLSNASPELSSGAYKAMAESRAAMVQAMTEQTDIQKQYYEFQANMYTKEIEEAQTNAAKVQARIDQAKFEGVMPAETDYAELRDAYKTQAEMQEELANFWDTVANSGKVNSVMRAIANQNAATARANAISANESANEADRGYLTDELLEKQNTYNDLQTEASQIEQQITDDETKHRKISNKRYDELIKNGDKQLANLEDQRETLVELRDKTIQGTDKWREYQSQLDDVDSSISNMKNSQIGWFESMTTAVSSNAQTLASALDSAFSEINSETGLTRDTMNTLVEQFSDLENYDVSKIFYSTADGMKFNTDATRELIDAEYDLQVNNLRDAIAEETAIIEANKDSKDANAYATIQNAQANINAYNAELASLQALYDQQQESLSRYSAWETAKSTANAGDKYTNLQGSWKDVQEMFSNGLTGTDDFKTFVAYFDEWGMGTIDAYNRNKDMITRYLTEDGKGMKNFYDDLVAKGFGTKEGNIYSIGIEDTEAAAHAMGMSEEALKMLLDRGEDYGFRNTWVETELDGELKLQETTEQLIEEQERLQNMRANGATAEQIKNQEDLVSQIKDNMKNYIENTADVAAEAPTKTYEKTISQLKAINELRGETFGSEVQMTDRELENYNRQLDDAMRSALGGYSKDQLLNFKAAYEVEMDDDSKRIVDQMIELAGQREEIQAYIDAEVNLHDSDGNGITPEEFLGMTEEQQAEVIEKTYGVSIDETNIDLWREQLQQETFTAKVKAVVDSGATSYDDLLNMNAEQLTQTIGIDVDESNIDEIKSKIEELSSVKVTLDESSITSLTTALGQAIALAISTDEASEQVEDFVSDTEDKTATMDADADTTKANTSIQQFINKVMALHPSISVICDASSLITSVQEILARQQFKVNVTAGNPTSAPTVVKPGKGGGATGGAVVTGRNNGRAYANGKPGDLVGELGREMIVDPHTGTYYTVGDNGPEFTDVPDDAIVFNADQTDDLLRHGHTATRGRALVTGNAFDSTNSTNEFVYNNPKNTFGKGVSDKATKDNTKATKDNTKASKEQKTALDKFNEWLGKWVDWIDNRIDTLTNRIERFEKTAEQAIGYVSKNNNIQEAMNTLSNLKTFQQGKLLTKDVTGTNGVTAQIATGTKNAKKGTLLGDTMRGAVRYQQQADKVMKKAVKSGLLSQKKANEIAKLIQTGEIDIRKYNEKVRAVISAYEDWFGKSQDLIDSTYELKQQFKDLEQTKLDNITERFETLVDLIEATKTASEATVDLYTTQGRAVNTDDRKQMLYQRNRQGRITEELGKEEKAYQDELNRARTIFGENSNEYRQARTQLIEIRKSLTESRNAELELTHAIEELRFTVRGFIVERLESFVEKLSGIASLAEKRGTNKALGYRVTEDPYAEQLRYNNDLILKYAEDLEDRKKEIARRVADPEEGLQINSSEYQELYNKIVADEQALLKLYSSNEDLKMSIRNLRWEEYKKFQETLENITGDLSHIQSFIRDGEILDNDGQFTARGFAQIALIGENMDNAEKKIANARGAIEKLNEELANGTINEETFGEEFEQQMKIIQDAASEAYDDMQKLADMYIKQITEENSILQDLIKSRQDALNKKKAYYDYDKQIREKNKDVNSLRAQVQALQNVSTDAAKARRAQLQAQLAEAEQDLNDTRYNHQIEMQQQGYEQLSEDMQKALDDSVKLINGDQKTLQKTAARMLDYLKENDVDEKAVIDSIIESAGTRIHEETKNALNNTLVQDEDGNLGLLSNLNVSAKEGADGIITAVMDIAKAIDMHEVAEAIKQINPSVETNKNSDNEDVGEQLKEIEKAYLDVDSTSGTTGESAKGTENVVRDDDQIMEDAKAEAERKQTIKEDKQTLSNGIASTDKQIADAEKHLKDLQDKHAKYNEDINKWKQKLKEANKISDPKKREKAVAKAQSKIDSLRAKRDKYIASENQTKDLISQLKANRANMQAQLNDYKAEEEAEYSDIIDQYEDKPTATQSSSSEAKTAVVSSVNAKSSTSTSNVRDAVANVAKKGNLNTDVLAAIALGEKHAKKITKAEKDNHAALWEYLVTNYGRTGNNKVYTALAKALGIKVSSTVTGEEKTKILKKLKAKGFASGTKRVGKDLDAWTNEDWENLGAEMIVRKSDGAILTPLKANDSVVPANLADNLFKWGAISPDKFLSNPFLGKMGDMPSNANVTNQVDQKVEMHFDSLFTIQGDVNADVMDRLEEFGKALTSDRNFQQNVVKFVTKDFVRESKKQGGFR